jgi:hypothetical protein
MHKLVAGFILIMALPMLGKAESPGDVKRQETAPGSSSETMPAGKAPAAADDEAYQICLRATQRFEQQEKEKGRTKTAEAPISASCKDELKPAPYWLCMDKEATEGTDFNTAHWRCAKQHNLVK